MIAICFWADNQNLFPSVEIPLPKGHSFKSNGQSLKVTGRASVLHGVDDAWITEEADAVEVSAK